MTLKLREPNSARRSTLDARVRTVKLLALILLAFTASAVLPSLVTAQQVATAEGIAASRQLSASEVTIPANRIVSYDAIHYANSSPTTFSLPADCDTWCVKFTFVLDNTGASCSWPSCCATQSCSNRTAIDNEEVPSWEFGRCGGQSFSKYLCLGTGDHTISTDWTCWLEPYSRVEISWSTSHCTCSQGGSCTAW